jgi:hypothetical protein
MTFAASLWRLLQEDRLFRWAGYAAVVILWFSIAWVDPRILLVGLAFDAAGYWWLRRQRERRGWFEERPVDVDLL